MSDNSHQSWGRYPRVEQEVYDFYWRDSALPALDDKTLLPFGNGRSYGDVCLNDGGAVLDCRHLNRFIHFDPDTGVLRCEAGVLLSEVLQLVVAKGWFPTVTPGTQFVTIGGAIANDVHGKNHHRAGTFGRHVRCFELLRSDGSRSLCSPTQNTELFHATIGGLGLTGVITWAEIQLSPVNNAFIDQEVIRFHNLAEFFQLARDSDQDYEHTVAWVDCLARGEQLGRGLFMRGNYATPIAGATPKAPAMHLTFPIDPPFALVNGLTLRAFNNLYYRKQRADYQQGLVHYRPFFYPLDAIYRWNRMYGSKGFFQYQCAVPTENMETAIHEILDRIGKAGIGSFLAVLKLLGDKPSPGLLSFPLPGATLALDFPNNGDKTLRLLKQLDEVTVAAGGRLYPAKDARMQGQMFRDSYPDWNVVESLRDPNISSSFWRRVTTQS